MRFRGEFESVKDINRLMSGFIPKPMVISATRRLTPSGISTFPNS